LAALLLAGVSDFAGTALAGVVFRLFLSFGIAGVFIIVSFGEVVLFHNGLESIAVTMG
jgi:hypothetical protein